MQAFGQSVHSAVEDADFGVLLAQRKKVACQFRGNHQADIFQVRGAGLVRGLRGFDAAAALAEEIHFVIHGKGNRVGVFRECLAADIRRTGRPAAAEPVAFRAGLRGGGHEAQRGEIGGHLNGGRGSRLFEVCNGNFQGLVGVERLLLERVQFLVLVNAPPLTLGQVVDGRAFAPRRSGVPLRGDFGGGPMVVRADGAARSEQQSAGKT